MTFFVILAFFLQALVLPAPVFAQSFNLPAPGVMVSSSPQFKPVLLKGVVIHPDNPLMFDFIVTPGHTSLKGEALKKESTKLIKYFLASLTTPEKDLWVNLSPYEKDRIIPDSFGVTEMGRDLLAQDYILKQLTASIVYPESDLGKEFWQKVYRQAAEKYGVADLPVNAFNKVWILPDHALVYEDQTKAIVLQSHLKVMLEEDYLLLKQNLDNVNLGTRHAGEKEVKDLSKISSQVVREIVIPAIEKEVNEGKNFANLRQVYHSLILATWFKKRLKQSLLGQIYVNQNRVTGVDVDDKAVKQKIYEQYLQAFKKGVYNYIKEDYDATTGKVIPRKYFSGGFWGGDLEKNIESTTNLAAVQADADLQTATQERVVLDPRSTGKSSAWSKRLKSLAVGVMLAWNTGEGVSAQEATVPPYTFSLASQNYSFGPNITHGGQLYSYGTSQSSGSYNFISFPQADVRGQSLLLIRPNQGSEPATYIYLWDGKGMPQYFATYRGVVFDEINVNDDHWYNLARFMTTDKNNFPLSSKDFQQLSTYWSSRVPGLATSSWFLRPSAAQKFVPAFGSSYSSPITFKYSAADGAIEYDGELHITNFETLPAEGKVISDDGTLIGDYSFAKYKDTAHQSKGVVVASLTLPDGKQQTNYYFVDRTTGQIMLMGSLPTRKSVDPSTPIWQQMANFIASPLHLSSSEFGKAKLAFETMEYQTGFSFYDGLRGTFSAFYLKTLLQALSQEPDFQFPEGYKPFNDLAYFMTGLNLADQQEVARQFVEVWDTLSFDVRTQVLDEFAGMDSSVIELIVPLLVQHLNTADDIFKVRQFVAPKILADLDYSSLLVRIIKNPSVSWDSKQKVLQSLGNLLTRSSLVRVPYIDAFFLESLSTLDLYGQQELLVGYSDVVRKFVQRQIGSGAIEDLQDISQVYALTKYVAFTTQTLDLLSRGLAYFWQDDVLLLPGLEHYYRFASPSQIQRIINALGSMSDDKVLASFVSLLNVPLADIRVPEADQKKFIERAVKQLMSKGTPDSTEAVAVIEKLKKDETFTKYSSLLFPLLEQYNPKSPQESNDQYALRMNKVRDLFLTHGVILRDLQAGAVNGKILGSEKDFIDLVAQAASDYPNTVFLVDLARDSLSTASHGYIRQSYSVENDGAEWVTDLRYQLGHVVLADTNRSQTSNIILIHEFEKSAVRGKGFITKFSSDSINLNYAESLKLFLTSTGATWSSALSEMAEGRTHQLSLFLDIARNVNPIETNNLPFFSMDSVGNVTRQYIPGAWDSGNNVNGVYRLELNSETYVVTYENLLIRSAVKLGSNGQTEPLKDTPAKSVGLASVASHHQDAQAGRARSGKGVPVAIQSALDQWTRLNDEQRMTAISQYQDLFGSLLDSGLFFENAHPAAEFFNFMMDQNEANPHLSNDPTLPVRIQDYKQRLQWHQEVQEQQPVVIPVESSDSKQVSTVESAPSGFTSTPGGIDFNPANLHLDIEIKGMGQTMPPIAPYELQDIQIEGFTPVILEMRPFDLSLVTDTSSNPPALSSLSK